MERGAQLIDKYIRQGLSPAERYELEKLALDDALLAEAWEGLSAPYAQDNLAATKRLDKRLLDVQESTAKVVPLHKKLWPYAVAASLALVMAVGVLLRQDASTDVAGFAAEQTVSPDRYEEDAPVAMMKEPAPESSTSVVSAVTTEVSNDVSVQVASSRKTASQASQENAYVASANVTSEDPAIENYEKIASKKAAVNNDHMPQPEFMAAKRISDSEDQVADVSPAVASARASKDKNLTVAAPSANGATATDQEIEYNASPVIISSEELATQMDVPVTFVDDGKSDAAMRTEEFKKSNGDVIVVSAEELATQMDMPVTYVNDTMKEESSRRTQEFKKKQKPIIISADEIAEKMAMPFTPIEPIIEPGPAIGFEAYEQLLNDAVEVGRDLFFMLGIKDYMPVYVQFKLNEKGMPKDISFVKNPSLSDEQKQQILKAFETASPWENVPSGKLVSYTLKLWAD